MTRILAKVREGGVRVEMKLGRPSLLSQEREDPTLRSDTNRFMFNYLRNIWANRNVDWNPEDRQYAGAINVLRVPDVYAEVKAVLAERTTRIPSLTTFTRVWDWWMKTDNIRMRKKKNVSGKCPGMNIVSLSVVVNSVRNTVCEALDLQRAVAKTLAETQKAKEDRYRHNQRIRDLRSCAEQAELQARFHPESLCMIQVSRRFLLFSLTQECMQVDCVDQTSVHVPSTWQKRQYDAHKKDSFYDQKLLLAVLEAPRQLLFYAGPPHVSLNTVFCLLLDVSLDAFWNELHYELCCPCLVKGQPWSEQASIAGMSGKFQLNGTEFRRWTAHRTM